MVREQFNTRLPNDDAEKVHQYGDDKGISKSESTRRLIRAGLHAEGYFDADTDTDTEPTQSLLEKYLPFTRKKATDQPPTRTASQAGTLLQTIQIGLLILVAIGVYGVM